VTTGAGGVLLSSQEFDPWGKVRSGGISETASNYTGQRLDSTDLLYYHARYYDPGLGRFLSADSIVPGSASGSMKGIALKPLTVDFHEPGFVGSLNSENQQGFWFRLSDEQRQEVGSPWGPANPQALNRYSYVQNNPMRYTDPTGHKTRSGILLREQMGFVTEDLEYSGDSGGGLIDAVSSVIGAVFEKVSAVLGVITGGRTSAYAAAKYTIQKALRIKNGAQYILDSRLGVLVYDAQGNFLQAVPWERSIGGGQVAVNAASVYTGLYGANDRAAAPNIKNPQERIGWGCTDYYYCGTLTDQESRYARPGEVTCYRKCFVMPADRRAPAWAR
jgi:RHS repeat-associated protein